MPTMRSILTLIWALGLALNLGAATARDAAQTKVDLLLGQETARPGSVVSVGLRLTTEPGWHTYWRNPGESGSPTTVEWTLPEGVVGTPLEGPAPEKIMIGGILTLAYHDEVVLLTTVALPSGLAAGKHSLRGKVQWLECSDKLCVPRSQTVSAEIVIGTDTKEGRDFTALKEAQAKLPKPSEALEASASWDGAGTQTERPVTLHWSVPPGVTHVDFFPYESKALSVRLTNEWSEIKEGRASVRRVVDRLEGEWPETLSGLVVFGQADVASHRFSEVSFKLSTPAVPIADAGGVAAVTVVSPPSAPAASISVLLRMLVFAFLGGAILNIMPCVLPVISLKILGFVNQSRTSPGRVRQLGLFYALGVLVSFLILAGMVIGLKQAGKAASWGIQFGNPQFLVVLTTLILLVSLNLFGVFEITLGGVAGSADQLARKEGGAGAFFNGVLAVVLATPCTAPFLGVSIGFAIAQHPATIVLFFATVALGLAFPYVLLSWNSAWLKVLPRPGVWMEQFKVAMGFPMLGAAMWLFWLTGKHFGDRSLWFGFFLIVVASAAWVYGQFIQRSQGRSILAWTVLLMLLGVGYGWALEKEVAWRSSSKADGSGTATSVSDHGPIDWKPWSAAAVAEARAQGRPILVDFTADWCAICGVNLRTSIKIPSVIEKLKEINAVALLGDYTTTPDDITDELTRWGRAGVPLVLVYPADPQLPPQVLPEVLTPSIVLEALSKAAK
jgi:thiol:disulfide interchange protein/DsbC/DsbD-like thiol-disulfide interchange protein